MLAKYLWLARITAQEGLAHRVHYLLAPGAAVLQVSLLYYFWSAVYASSESVPELTLAQLVTYVCVGQAVNASYVFGAERDIADKIVWGDVSLDLLKPLEFQTARLWEAIGATAVRGLPITASVLVFSVVFLHVSPPEDLLVGGVFLVSVGLSFLTNFGINFSVQMLAFYMAGNVWGLTAGKRAVMDFFSGALVPLALLPGPLHALALALPFKGIIDTPLSIYIGEVSRNEMPGVLGQQIAWILVLLLAGRVFWAFTSKRVTIHGG